MAMAMSAPIIHLSEIRSALIGASSICKSLFVMVNILIFPANKKSIIPAASLVNEDWGICSSCHSVLVKYKNIAKMAIPIINIAKIAIISLNFFCFLLDFSDHDKSSKDKQCHKKRAHPKQYANIATFKKRTQCTTHGNQKSAQ